VHEIENSRTLGNLFIVPSKGMLWVDSRYQSAFGHVHLATCADVFEFFAGPRGSASDNTPIRRGTLMLDNHKLNVVFKQYDLREPSWRFLCRESKARREYRSYCVFERLGIPHPGRIACGEVRDRIGRLLRAFVLMREVEHKGTLIDFFRDYCPNRDDGASRQTRNDVIREIATVTRRLHEAQFFHNDLHWRNILVNWNTGAAPSLCWIDCPRGRFDRWSPLRHHRRVKDLATLDFSAQNLCSYVERLLFLKVYLQKTRLDGAARALIHDVLSQARQLKQRKSKKAKAQTS
jgi:tRNA A-37 threonylcarbamoyl transferase component Bud32